MPSRCDLAGEKFVHKHYLFVLGIQVRETAVLKRVILGLLLTLTLMSTLTLTGRLHASGAPAAIPGDVNRDNKVDIVDAVIVSAAFGSTSFDPSWNGNADINSDGLINILDLVVVAVHFGESCVDREDGVFAGWRSSPYGFQQEANPAYWIDVANYMASKIRNSVPSGVWVWDKTLPQQQQQQIDVDKRVPVLRKSYSWNE